MKVYIEINDEQLDDFSAKIAESLLVQTRSKVKRQLQAEMQVWIDELKERLKESVVTEHFWLSLRARCQEQMHAVLSQEAIAFCTNYRGQKQFNELLERVESELFDRLFGDDAIYEALVKAVSNSVKAEAKQLSKKKEFIDRLAKAIAVDEAKTDQPITSVGK